jgi:ParB family chromosome partitioning protein
MAVQKKFALGRGLDALISTNDEVKTSGSSSINEVELSKISVNPNQPRREFDPIALQELADSIAEIGIIQPITITKSSIILKREVPMHQQNLLMQKSKTSDCN